MKQKVTRSFCIVALVAAACALCCCSRRKPADARPELQGMWLLREVLSFDYKTLRYPNDNGVTQLCIYTADSTCYACDFRFMDDAVAVSPDRKITYSCTDKGNGGLLYLEDGHPRPLKFLNDSTIQLRRLGRRFTYVRASGFVEAHSGEIESVVRRHSGDDSAQPQWFVFSKRETELRSANHTLFYVLIAIVIIAAAIVDVAMRTHRRNERLRQRLKQIEEERKLRPEKLEMALKEVEDDFFKSDCYTKLRQRIVDGDTLDADAWKEMENALNRVYPNFTNRLKELINMSDVEYKVCLLVKLRIAPKDIAAVLYKDRSSISTIRSRLYQKVFHKKGGSADWDDFIGSL